jgi:hypothetical protein
LLALFQSELSTTLGHHSCRSRTRTNDRTNRSSFTTTAITPMIAPIPDAPPTFATSSFVEIATSNCASESTLGELSEFNGTDFQQYSVKIGNAIVGRPNVIKSELK